MDPQPLAHLDLRGTPCPLNFIRTRLALEKLPPGGWLRVQLDPGEPEQMVAEGMRNDGHSVSRRPQPQPPDGTASGPGEPASCPGVALLIRRAGG
jgi:TusA-related sulfurtransferase